MKEKYMNLAIKEAQKAYKNKEVPVGCIIVKNNKVVAKAHNKIEKKQQSAIPVILFLLSTGSEYYFSAYRLFLVTKLSSVWYHRNCIFYKSFALALRKS